MLLLLAQAPEAVSLASPYLQYGCFGLVVMLVVWAVTWGFPKALEKHENTVKTIMTDSKEAIAAQAEEHKEAVQALTQAFTDESKACREERRQVLDYLTNEGKT